MGQCSYIDCGFECYESSDKCIFHCSKDDWFTPKRKIWIQKKVGEFWEAIRIHRTKINNEFIGFIFPRFEEYECSFNSPNGDKHQTNNYNEISSKNFGLRDSYHNYYAYIQNAFFDKCIFLDNADFSKIALQGKNTFTEVMFKKDILFPSNNITNLDFTKSIFEQDVVLSQMQLTHCDFTKVAFKKIADFSEINISIDVMFDESIYENDLILKNSNVHSANFKGIHVKGTVVLDNSTISHEVDFSESTFEKEFTFKEVNVVGETNFSNAIFKKEADFQNGEFGSDANFSDTVFKADALFSQRECKGSLDAFSIKIEGDALFDVNNIQGNVNFSESTFEKEFTFKDVDVQGETNFSKVTFNNNADFQDGSFGSNANFSETKFECDGLFTQRTFNGNADFNGNFHYIKDEVLPEKVKMYIKGKALFDVDNIAGDANFSNTEFEKEFTFLNVLVTGETNFSGAIFKDKSNFKNSIFEKNVNFRGAKFSNTLNLSNSIFKATSEFSFMSVKGSAFFTSSLYENDISFVSSTFEQELLFDGVILNGKIDAKYIEVYGMAIFLNGVCKEKVDFSQSTFHSNLIFSHKIFEKSAEFYKIHIKGNSYFDSVLVEGNLSFKKGKIDKDLVFDNATLKGASNFIGIEVKSKTSFQLCSFKNIDFSESLFLNDLFFNSSEFNKNSIFNNTNTKNIDFSNVKFKEKDRKGDSNFDLELNNSKYGRINFNNAKIGQDLTCKDSYFKALDFNNSIITRWSEVEFRNIDIDILIFDKYVNESDDVLFDFITVNDKLLIRDVSFDKEKFNHFNMSKAEVEIENSAFNNNFFNSVKWGTISEKRYKASRDIFRQLKFYSENQKNFIDADGFYSLEMKEQKKELQKENKELQTRWEKISHFFTNTLVFYLHEKASNFSQNWWLPIFWLLIVGMLGIIYKNLDKIDFVKSVPIVLVYLLLCYVLPIAYRQIYVKSKMPKLMIYSLVALPFMWIYFQVSTDYFNDIARLLNPSNIFKPIVLEKKHEFVSLLYKITVLFLVYQVITAIKKKVRSK